MCQTGTCSDGRRSCTSALRRGVRGKIRGRPGSPLQHEFALQEPPVDRLKPCGVKLGSLSPGSAGK